jgi:seryl-tRNA synthetase
VTLTVADIDRWNAGAVREVFQAANARGQATLEASRQLSALSVFDNWEGATAEARKHVNAGIRQDLDTHGNEALAVARAADQAADGIEHVQSDLRALRSDASELHMAIDAMTNRVVPGANCLQTEALIAEMQLQPRLDAILAEANAVDQELATAINMADGDTAIPPDAGPPVGAQGLTPTQRESDANQERVREERAKLQAHINDLKQAITRAGGDQNRLQDLNSQLNAAQNRMGEYDAIDDALRRAPETYLTQLDIPTDPSQKVKAAVAVGNPDTATDISVTVLARHRLDHQGFTAEHGLRGAKSAEHGKRGASATGAFGFGGYHRVDGLRPAGQCAQHDQPTRFLAHRQRRPGEGRSGLAGSLSSTAAH